MRATLARAGRGPRTPDGLAGPSAAGAVPSGGERAPAQIGLDNGDTITAVKRLALDSTDRALEIDAKVREASAIEITGTRRGKPLALFVSIH